MEEVKLKEPQDLRTDKPNRMQFDMVKRSPISPEKMTELELQVKGILEEEKTHTATMRRRLNTLNDMLEGVAQDVQYPFPNASNVDCKMAIGTARTMRATMIRALISDPERVFVASIDYESRREESNQVEAAFNWKAAHENGLIDAIKDSIIPIFRDGLTFIQGIWEKDVQRVIDYRSYDTAEAFMADYPDPESAGVEEAKYTEIIRKLAEPEATLDICFERDHTMKDGAAFSIVTLPRFHWWPLSARNLSECELYGVRMDESEATMKKKRKTKEYKSDVVDACLTGVSEGGIDQWGRSRDFIEGISRQSEKRKEYENYRLVLTLDLDGDDIPEKYMGVFNLKAGRFLNFDRYKIRNNIDFLVPCRFEARDDRLLGRSLLYDGADLFQEITDIHRSRNNNRMLSDTVAFKANKGKKDDLEGQLNGWRPGVVVWVDKMDDVEQFALQNRSNTQNSLDEESALRGYSEFVVGPTQGLSGQETKGDASAPATKHLSKIRQAGYRVDDYLDELRRSFPNVGKLALALDYQYGLREMAYRAKGKDGSMSSAKISRALFGIEGLSMDLNARSVIMSPEFEMERIMALANAAAANPAVIARNPNIAVVLWNRFVVASRTQNPEELKVDETMPPPMPVLPGAPGGATTPPSATGQAPGVGTRVPALKSLLAGLGAGNPSERPQQ